MKQRIKHDANALSYCAYLFLALSVVLFACADIREPALSEEGVAKVDTSHTIKAETNVFSCSDGFQFIARIERDMAWLFLPDTTVSLSKTEMASGDTYGQEDYVFERQDGEASLQSRETTYDSCTNNVAAAIWEAAKLDGVSFRAVGNEPGWHLEIKTEEILLVSNYGAQQRAFGTPTVEADEETATSIYQASRGGDTLVVVIKGEPCQDTMSGEAFETKVTVMLDETTLQGCGRALH